jgi:hypothetical protein
MRQELWFVKSITGELTTCILSGKWYVTAKDTLYMEVEYLDSTTFFFKGLKKQWVHENDFRFIQVCERY